MDKTALETTESILNYIAHGNHGTVLDGKADSQAFTLVAAAQSVVRAEQTLQHVVGAYKES